MKGLDSIQDIRVFDAIGRSDSLSIAAGRLGLSLTQVSKRLRHLETVLNVRLVQRTTRSLALTADGLDFLDSCREVLRAVAMAEDIRSSPEKGVIRLGAAIALSQRHIAPSVPRFLDDNPGVSLQILASNQPSNLIEQGLDLAIRQLPMEDSSLIMRRLAPDAWMLCASPEYVANWGMPQEPAELSHHRCLMVGDPPPSHWRLTRGEDDVVVPLSAHISGSDGEIVHAAMLAGGGIAMKGAWDVFDDIRAGRLVRVLPSWWGGRDRWMHIVYPARTYQPRRVRSLMDFLIDELNGVLRRNVDLELFDRPVI